MFQSSCLFQCNTLDSKSHLNNNYSYSGGVCAYVNQNLKCEAMKELSYIAESGLHQLWLKIQFGNFRSFVICTTYRPTDTSLCCFDTDLSGTLTSALSLNKPIYIIGDLNCNVLNTNDPGQSALLNFCNCFNLTQLVEEPTRITDILAH